MTYPPQPGQPGQPDPYGRPPQSGGFPQQGGWDPNQQQQPYPTQQYPQGWDPSQQGYAPPSGGFPANPQPAWGDPGTQQQAWGDPNAQQQAWADPNAQQQQWADPNAQQSAWADPNAQQYGQQAWTPNAGGQVSGWDPATGGYSQGFGGPPTPPKKSRTGMWIAVGAAVVVVLALVGVTGFVTPGFFLSKDNTAAAPQPSTSANPSAPKTKPSTSGGGSDAKAVLQGFIDKLNAGDNAGAVALGCANSKRLLDSWLRTFLKPPLQLRLGEVPDDEYLAEGQVTGTAAGKPVKGTLSATNFDEKGFCISTMLVS
ncbi:hypothetical protein DMA12_47205 [Amycolatopsis balhimycina DSM 5908]|uniref:Uncharacterized protein n=1 Tax=Amycolatopsis balhimycina DSM 5908 TaxID=1081091 RepID=A0A428VVB0_AMYBA|nr:hypothetical protein [Amycolatopsis balhimycina]RSM34718.1 hypothetical protein DMA12_47205 [Amycolatopsis balhimycina DSM 5908]